MVDGTVWAHPRPSVYVRHGRTDGWTGISLHIECLIDEVSHSASCLPYDLQFMHDGALFIQVALNNLSSRSSSFSPQSSATLDELHSLNMIKKNMELACDILRTAESWSTLESEVSSLLSEQSYEKATESSLRQTSPWSFFKIPQNMKPVICS